jgi:cell division septation protein DedD
LRRFYGKTQAERLAGIYDLLQYSLNRIDQPSLYRGPSSVGEIRLDDRPISAETRAVIRDELDATRSLAPGDGAGVMPRSSATIDLAVPAESSSVPAAGAPAPASAPAPAPAEPAPVVPRVAPSGEGN